MRIAQDQEYPHWVSRARPLTEAERRQSVHPDSLWHLVEVLDENVAGWVYERLAHVRRVDDVDTGERLAQQGHDNITRRGYLQNHNGGRSLLRWLKLALGGQALAAHLREVRARLDTLDDLVDEAQDRVSARPVTRPIASGRRSRSDRAAAPAGSRGDSGQAAHCAGGGGRPAASCNYEARSGQRAPMWRGWPRSGRSGERHAV